MKTLLFVSIFANVLMLCIVYASDKATIVERYKAAKSRESEAIQVSKSLEAVHAAVDLVDLHRVYCESGTSESRDAFRQGIMILQSKLQELKPNKEK